MAQVVNDAQANQTVSTRSAAPAPAPTSPAPRSGSTSRSSSGTTTASTTATVTPTLSDAELAANYGFAMAVLNSDPELSALFHQAVAETWTAEKFQASLMATSWYQTHSEQWRNATILKASDPTTYSADVAQTATRIGMMATQMGAVLPNLDAFAETAYLFGWDDNQITSNLATYVQYTDGRLLGQAGQWEQQLRNHAADMGVTLSDDWFRNQIVAVDQGKQTVDDVARGITAMAASAYPNLADRLKAGETLRDIADPYRQSMASLLEIPADSITLADPMVKSALSFRGPDGKVATKTLYEFEQDVRKDSRWLKTSNAQDSLIGTAHNILRDFGLVGA